MPVPVPRGIPDALVADAEQKRPCNRQTGVCFVLMERQSDMSLPAGKRLGHFEILEAIGAGGMGQIYRARDTRLGRDVAIKILPPELASHPGFQERFGREARIISSLNHPRICILHDIGQEEGLDRRSSGTAAPGFSSASRRRVGSAANAVAEGVCG